MATRLFEGKKVTDGEQEFISNVLKDNKMPEHLLAYATQAQALATLRLAKEVEESTISNNKSAKALNWLTGAIALIAFVQIFLSLRQ